MHKRVQGVAPEWGINRQLPVRIHVNIFRHRGNRGSVIPTGRGNLTVHGARQNSRFLTGLHARFGMTRVSDGVPIRTGRTNASVVREDYAAWPGLRLTGGSWVRVQV